MNLPINISLSFVLILMLGLNQIAEAQVNLVPNGSFEQYDNCPEYVGIEDATGWINPSDYSPDYFNSCASLSFPYFGVPDNGYGHQIAKTGMAYGGIYLPVNAGNNVREYIQVELMDTLTPGVEYIVSFYVSLADSSIFSVNSLGAYFSNNAISSTDNLVFSVVPQVVNNPTSNPLTDKTLWQLVSDTMIASGGEKFMTIGNFQMDSDADTISVAGGGDISDASYYYIDDVSVVEASPNSLDEFIENQVSVYPNPASELVFVKASIPIETLTIYSSTGQMVVQMYPKSTKPVVDLSQFPEGIYYLKVDAMNSLVTNKIIINR